MLLALSAQEGQDLQERAAMLQQNGIRATYHSQAAVAELEPALQLPHAGGALLVESDSQLVSAAHMQCKSNACIEVPGSSHNLLLPVHATFEATAFSPSVSCHLYSTLTCHYGRLVLHLGASCTSTPLHLPLAVAMLHPEQVSLVHLGLMLNYSVGMVPSSQCCFIHTCAQQPVWKAAVDIVV